MKTKEQLNLELNIKLIKEGEEVGLLDYMINDNKVVLSDYFGDALKKNYNLQTHIEERRQDLNDNSMYTYHIDDEPFNSGNNYNDNLDLDQQNEEFYETPE